MEQLLLKKVVVKYFVASTNSIPRRITKMVYLLKEKWRQKLFLASITKRNLAVPPRQTLVDMAPP